MRPAHGPVPGRHRGSGRVPEPDGDMGAHHRPDRRRPALSGAGGGAGPSIGAHHPTGAQDLDSADLDTHLTTWLCTRTGTINGRTVIAVDGKTMRGARTGDAPAPHLLSALDQATGAVLTQQGVADKSNEIPALRRLLESPGLSGTVVSADAMHTQVDTAQWITQRGGHYLLTPLDNQKTLRRTLKALPWKDVPSISSVDTSHGRRMRRTVKAIEAPRWVDFPGSAQVAQVRRTRTVKGRKAKTAKASSRSVEVVYLICSLPMTDAQPETVAAWIRGHWGIENRLHWVRDVVFDENRHQLRTGNGPKVMATLRNLATRPHPPGPRHRHLHRQHHQIPVTTTQTSHQTTHPNRPCRPPDHTNPRKVIQGRVWGFRGSVC